MVGVATVIEICSTPSRIARAISKRAPSNVRTSSLLQPARRSYSISDCQSAARSGGHGFGLGLGTSAEGWIADAVRFWAKQIERESHRVRALGGTTRGPTDQLMFVGVCAQVANRIVSELCHIPPETKGKHGDFREHSDADRGCGKSLMVSALVRFDVRY